MSIIYKPKGAALEYASFACNLFTGCTGQCTYCFNRKGITAKVLGGDKPTLRKCFKDESDALAQFQKELIKKKNILQNEGIFFSFVGDPFCDESFPLIYGCIFLCMRYYIPVTVLTKQTGRIDEFIKEFEKDGFDKKLIKIGFTLTGCNDLETGCSTNEERIESLSKLHDRCFKTWISLEPIIDIMKSFKMFIASNNYTDIYKIGLESGKKYKKEEVVQFVENIKQWNCYSSEIILKNSIKKYL